MSQPESITVSITRVVKPGLEEGFERALHQFVERSLALPGQLGVHVMRPEPGSGSREYGIIRKFRDREALAEFHRSSEYLEWSRTVAGLTEGEGRFEELCGLESWFTLPGGALRPLPQWKMALLTLMGVYPTSLLLGETVGPLTRDWPTALAGLVFAAAMVALLTWVVMPLLSRIFHGWLQSASRKEGT